MSSIRQRSLPTGLGARLALMMLLALLPLGLLALVQTRNILRQAEEGQILAAMGETVQFAMPEILAIRSARSLAEGLAGALLPVVDDAAACNDAIARVARGQRLVSLIAYVPLSGQMDCATAGAGTNLQGTQGFQRQIEARRPLMQIYADAKVSATSVLAISQPVFDAKGRYLGFVSVSVPHRALIDSQNPPGVEAEISPLALITFNEEGELLSASHGLEMAEILLPRGATIRDLARRGGRAFFQENANGVRLLYTVVPIAGSLFVMGVWTPTESGLAALGVEPFLFPLLMWLAGLAVALWGAERLVVRHIRRLSAGMRDFTLGGRDKPQIVLEDPPAEIGALADAYRKLTYTILHDETELQALLRQKEELLREVHHRTGNSLQLIASILRMHRRETRSEGVLQLLDDLHGRVMRLSTVHLGLYRIAGREDVAVNALISEVISKMRALHGRSGPREPIDSDLAPLVLTAQQAVPLALLLAEILSCFPQDELDHAAVPTQIRLDVPAPDLARLTVTGNAAARGILTGERDGAPAVIAARLIRGFVAQLSGEMQVDAQAASVSAVITFPIRGSGPGGDTQPRPEEAAAAG